MHTHTFNMTDLNGTDDKRKDRSGLYHIVKNVSMETTLDWICYRESDYRYD